MFFRMFFIKDVILLLLVLTYLSDEAAAFSKSVRVTRETKAQLFPRRFDPIPLDEVREHFGIPESDGSAGSAVGGLTDGFQVQSSRIQQEDPFQTSFQREDPFQTSLRGQDEVRLQPVVEVNGNNKQFRFPDRSEQPRRPTLPVMPFPEESLREKTISDQRLAPASPQDDPRLNLVTPNSRFNPSTADPRFIPTTTQRPVNNNFGTALPDQRFNPSTLQADPRLNLVTPDPSLAAADPRFQEPGFPARLQGSEIGNPGAFQASQTQSSQSLGIFDRLKQQIETRLSEQQAGGPPVQPQSFGQASGQFSGQPTGQFAGQSAPAQPVTLPSPALPGGSKSFFNQIVNRINQGHRENANKKKLEEQGLGDRPSFQGQPPAQSFRGQPTSSRPPVQDGSNQPPFTSFPNPDQPPITARPSPRTEAGSDLSVFRSQRLPPRQFTTAAPETPRRLAPATENQFQTSFGGKPQPPSQDSIAQEQERLRAFLVEQQQLQQAERLKSEQARLEAEKLRNLEIQEAERIRKAEEERKKAVEKEERARKEEEERKRKFEEALRIRELEEKRLKEELLQQRLKEEEERRVKAEREAAERRRKQEEEIRRKQAEEAERLRRIQEEEIRRKQAEEAERLRRIQEVELRRKQEEELRRKQEEEVRIKQAEADQRRKVLEEQQRFEEAARAIERNSGTEDPVQDTNVIINHAASAVREKTERGEAQSSPAVWAAVKSLSEFLKVESKIESVPRPVLMAIIQLTNFLDSETTVEPNQQQQQRFSVQQPTTTTTTPATTTTSLTTTTSPAVPTTSPSSSFGKRFRKRFRSRIRGDIPRRPTTPRPRQSTTTTQRPTRPRPTSRVASPSTNRDDNLEFPLLRRFNDELQRKVVVAGQQQQISEASRSSGQDEHSFSQLRVDPPSTPSTNPSTPPTNPTFPPATPSTPGRPPSLPALTFEDSPPSFSPTPSPPAVRGGRTTLPPFPNTTPFSAPFPSREQLLRKASLRFDLVDNDSVDIITIKGTQGQISPGQAPPPPPPPPRTPPPQQVPQQLPQQQQQQQPQQQQPKQAQPDTEEMEGLGVLSKFSFQTLPV